MWLPLFPESAKQEIPNQEITGELTEEHQDQKEEQQADAQR